jgi:superfamily II DNA/RNA helicase
MIEYNAYFGERLAELAALHGDQGLLRTQREAHKAATYTKVVPGMPHGTQGHCSLGLQFYAHMSSPIRRFSDLYNQHVLAAWTAGTGAALADAQLIAFNKRCDVLKKYHGITDSTALAYACRGSARNFACRMEIWEDGASLVVQTEHKRMRVNIRDTYFAGLYLKVQDSFVAWRKGETTQAIAILSSALGLSDSAHAAVLDTLHTLATVTDPHALALWAARAWASLPAAGELPLRAFARLLALAAGHDSTVSLSGILKSGRTQLRVRISDVAEWLRRQQDGSAPFRADSVSSAGTADRLPSGDAELEGRVDAQLWEGERVEDEADEPVQRLASYDVAQFEEAVEQANVTLGYPIDDFQRRSLRVILRRDMDLLAMAPTGSGKTAVALLAILQAFARGQRAIYTSPIKALSNQKYAEFKQWFRSKGVRGEVSLLTGDIKIRAPPGTQNELMICTSEILRNKLVKNSGKHNEAGGQRADDIDPDLHRLGCVVSDEVHYINDPERGSVWEETLMHLPRDVQMVALSATLKEPEKFVDWISSTRHRPGEIVTRTDRHVPLYFGGLSNTKAAEDAEFIEMFSTHGDRKNVFIQDRFHETFPTAAEVQKVLKEQKDAKKASASSTDARSTRDAELLAKRLEQTGGAMPKGNKGQAAPGRAAGGSGSGKEYKFNFVHEVNRLVTGLDSQDKLPAIVFCMSRRACVTAALGVHGNPLFGVKCKKPAVTPGTMSVELLEWEEQEAERSHRVREIEARRTAMHRKHLQRFSSQLKELEAYHELDSLLKRGIAYHHAGMLPILREYVELCFQERLIRVVFATETLAVGVNMPARTVVFTQLDKPDNQGRGHRWCRCDEFWQMAGRAGRRGMDTQGFVVYAPTLSVAGEKNRVPIYELNRMLTGSMPSAESQLVIDESFVLRHLGKVPPCPSHGLRAFSCCVHARGCWVHAGLRSGGARGHATSRSV